MLADSLEGCDRPAQGSALGKRNTSNISPEKALHVIDIHDVMLFQGYPGDGRCYSPRAAPWAVMYSPFRRFYVLSKGCSISTSRYENGDTRRIDWVTPIVAQIFVTSLRFKD